MIGSINTSVTAQPVKAAENYDVRKISEKEQPAEQTSVIRKRDRLELSSEALRYGSPDDPMARKAFDEAHKAASANDSE